MKLDGNYVAGFVDGEGCFYIRHYEKKKYSCPEFAIKVRLDDWQIICAIKESLGCGKIFRKQEKNRHNQAIGLLICRKEDIIKKVIPFFETYPLLAKKKVDFDLWKEAALMWSNGEFKTEKGKKRLLEIRSQLNVFREDIARQIPEEYIHYNWSSSKYH